MKQIKDNTKPLIMLTAGGTGGHVYPAEALAEELNKRGYRLALVTDRRGKDNYKGCLGEIPNYAVWAGGVVGKSWWFKIKSLFKVSIGILQAVKILLKLKPICVVGFGGYASFPCCVAAILLGKELIIHEQNSVMSRTNRFLSRYANLIAQSFKNVKYTPQNVKTVLTGMPIRQSIAEVGKKAYPSLKEGDKMQILILGGSQGARIFGDVIPEVMKGLDEIQQGRFKIVQQCRLADLEDVRKAYKGAKCEIVTSHFFENMPEIYANSHLVISRAGASSVSEFAVAGVPSILVPLPTAADDHQTGNAAFIGEARGGVVLNQKEFNVAKVSRMILDLLNDFESLEMMSNNAKKVSISNAAERFADAIEHEVLKNK